MAVLLEDVTLDQGRVKHVAQMHYGQKMEATKKPKLNENRENLEILMK